MQNPGVFFSVVYPKALPYLKDVRESALAQTRKDFEFLLINDGCDSEQIVKELRGINVTILDSQGGFTHNRLQGINYARSHGYKYLVFCDADDSFTLNRYERTIDEFEESKADIVVCNLNIANEKCEPVLSNYFSKEIQDDRWIEAEFLNNKNIFGMSNTALRLNSLQGEIHLPETPIVDWLLFTVLLLKGLKAKYITDSLVNYRQYSTNMIGITKYDVSSFRRLARLKSNHYRLLIEAGYNQYESISEEIMSLQSLSDMEIENIVKRELAVHSQPLWWQIIKK